MTKARGPGNLFYGKGDRQVVEFILQGRRITAHDIGLVKSLIISNSSWNRTRLSKELCVRWDWRRTTGELKDIACRSLLRKLEQLDHIQLPKPIHKVHKNHNPTRRNQVEPVLHSKKPIQSPLKELSPKLWGQVFYFSHHFSKRKEQ